MNFFFRVHFTPQVGNETRGDKWKNNQGREKNEKKSRKTLLEEAILTHSGLYLFRADVHAIYLSEVRRCLFFFCRKNFFTPIEMLFFLFGT
jgi:hypothetical protein